MTTATITGYKIIPFEAPHIRLIRNVDESKFYGISNEQMIRYSHEAQKSGPAWTVITDGEVILCGGAKIVMPGMGEAWTYFSEDIHSHALAVHRIVKKMLQFIIDEHKLRRIQAISKETVPDAGRWLEALGFQKEGVLRKFGPEGDNFVLYARVM